MRGGRGYGDYNCTLLCIVILRISRILISHISLGLSRGSCKTVLPPLLPVAACSSLYSSVLVMASWWNWIDQTWFDMPFIPQTLVAVICEASWMLGYLVSICDNLWTIWWHIGHIHGHFGTFITSLWLEWSQITSFFSPESQSYCGWSVFIFVLGSGVLGCIPEGPRIATCSLLRMWKNWLQSCYGSYKSFTNQAQCNQDFEFRNSRPNLFINKHFGPDFAIIKNVPISNTYHIRTSGAIYEVSTNRPFF